MFENFANDGFVKLAGALAYSDIQDMRDRLWELMCRKGAVRDAPETWRQEQGYGLQAVRELDPSFIDNPGINDALNMLFGHRNWRSKNDWGQTLVTMPEKKTWRLPDRAWHFDWAHRDKKQISGVNVFLFVDDVAPQGGGTVAVKGSPAVTLRFFQTHTNVEKMSDVNHKFACFHPWLSSLTKDDGAHDRNMQFMDKDTKIFDTAVRVVELTGKAGDVIIGHPGLFHTGAPNVSDRARLMRVQRVSAT